MEEKICVLFFGRRHPHKVAHHRNFMELELQVKSDLLDLVQWTTTDESVS